MKQRFSYIFQLGVYKFKHAFDIFDVSLPKMITYFLFLNLLMFLPITTSIIKMDHIDYSFWGMTFHEEVPSYIENGLPENCLIYNNQLQCGTSEVYSFTFTNKEDIWTVYLNEKDIRVHEEEHTIVFYQNWITMRFSGDTEFILDYDYFNQTDFEDLNELTPEARYDTLINHMFNSLKDIILLPAILMITGALLIMNFILLVTISLISMMFKFNQSEFPSYKNMFKLFILASTIPTLINVGLGFNGLNPFTTIVYNIATPIIAFFMYRASRQYLEMND